MIFSKSLFRFWFIGASIVCLVFILPLLAGGLDERLAADLPGVEQAQASPPAPGTPHLLHDAELSALKKKLESALEEENYEEAARLRDRIRELESS